MNKADCILSFAAHWLAVRSAVDQDEFPGYEWAADQALDEAEAAWAALNEAIKRRAVMAEVMGRSLATIEHEAVLQES